MKDTTKDTIIRWVITIDLGDGPVFWSRADKHVFKDRESAERTMRAFQDKGDLTRVFSLKQISTMSVSQARCYKNEWPIELMEGA